MLALLQPGIGLHRVGRLVPFHLLIPVIFCATSWVLAQNGTAPAETDAHHAGMFEAFRVCVKQKMADGEISTQDYQRCDLIADRLYFNLYNTPKNYRDTTFVPNVQTVVQEVVAHPDLCQSNSEFDKIGEEVLKDIQATYPDHRAGNCGTNPCGLHA